MTNATKTIEKGNTDVRSDNTEFRLPTAVVQIVGSCVKISGRDTEPYFQSSLFKKCHEEKFGSQSETIKSKFSKELVTT